MDAPKERIRLQKYLSQAEICSRRAAETLIANGEITVNGQVAELGQTVISGEDDVRLNGKKISLESRPRIVLMMNKPRGYVCSNLDPHNAQTIFQLISPDYAAHKLFCIGRLDKDSEGLLLITNDGDLANKVMHPSGNILKRYEVTLNRDFDPALTPRLLKGVKIKNENDEFEFLQFANVIRFPDSKRLEIHLKQGRKREIRRLLEVFGFFVKTLVRFQVGGLILKKMPPGDCRKLSQNEIDAIFAKGGNAALNHSRLKKPNRAALRGEKASLRKTSTHKKISTRSVLREREAQNLRQRLNEKPEKPTQERIKPDEEITENPSFKRTMPEARENLWQSKLHSHYKNVRTRSYASRKKK